MQSSHNPATTDAHMGERNTDTEKETENVMLTVNFASCLWRRVMDSFRAGEDVRQSDAQGCGIGRM